MQRSSIIRGTSLLAVSIVLAACSKQEEAPPPPTESPAPAVEAAPTPTPVSQTVRAFGVGELQAFALSDGGLDLPNDNKVFGVGQTPEDVAAVLSAAGQPTDSLHLDIHPLLVKTGDKVLLFDTGAGANFGPGAGKLAASLAEAGVDANGITDVFISHSHGDHVGGLVNGEGALAFPNATIHLSNAEWKHLSAAESNAALAKATKPKVKTFAPNAELVPGVVRAVEVKGHTPGHSAYRIMSGQESLLYVGDSMHHFVVSVQKPEWIISFDGDGKTGAASRATLIADSAAAGQRIYAVHFPFPGLGKFEKKGEGFVWVAE
jgi:glyoxylase-like metal-dependent hydrolase (beta-lactamase superfamily II)